MQVRVHDSITQIPADDWNRLAGDVYPFLRHEFLHAAESSGCVSPQTGWTPRHLTIAGDGLRAAMPLYEKTHSWGEFVFDWAWARAYERAGLDYYPRLVSAVPFTPAPSRRLLLADDTDHEAAETLISGAIDLAGKTGCSSLHILFPAVADIPLLRENGLKLRKDCQFHWHNQGYATFDDFLSTFSSAKRRKARRDRRLVTDAGFRFRRLHGDALDPELWRIVHDLISRTFMLRGSLPYFDREFFENLSRLLPDNILVILAERHGKAVAAAVFFESDTVLYGRYWGATKEYNALHFETCYYQGIDYCIDKGIHSFEPGTQGEHKVSRGFVPVPTYSAHWLAHPEFFSAIGHYLDEEGQHIDRYMRAIDDHSPYRRDKTDDR